MQRSRNKKQLGKARDNKINKELDQRIAAGWRRFGEYREFMKEKKIQMCLKRKLVDTVRLPAMAYGAETWTPAKHQESQLAVAQRSMEGIILNIM